MTVPAGALVRDRTLPELGYGRVLVKNTEGTAVILYKGDPTPREIRIDDQKDVVRARLHPGQRVLIEPKRTGRVLRAAGDADDLWTYAIDVDGHEVVAEESALTPLAAETSDPAELFEALDWGRPGAFASRAALLRRISLWHENGFGIPALLGARIHYLPHQIHAARRVLCDRTPRFVLADEVGLGKTIEAGLVIQGLCAADPSLRVLVVAPGAMSRQWLCELFLRFGEQVFVLADTPRLRESGEDACELLTAPRLIVSTTALESRPEVSEQLLAQHWDVVVIDEAHQVPPSSPLYAVLRELSAKAHGLLALSATPSKRDVEGLLGLLALVSPEAHDPADASALTERLRSQEAVAARLLETQRATRATPDAETLGRLAASWDGLLPGDTVVDGLVARLREGEAGAADELVAYVQEFHRLDRRIIRTRRATVRSLGTELCDRELETIDYAARQSEVALTALAETFSAEGLSPMQSGLRSLYLRVSSTSPLFQLELLETRRKALGGLAEAQAGFDPFSALASDPGPAEEEELRGRLLGETPRLPGEDAWLKESLRLTHAWMIESQAGCARFRAAAEWIQAHLRGPNRKVLVFAQDREVVTEFTEMLQERLGPDAVGAIHHALEEQELSERAIRFQRPGGFRVLVSDELGGEGRNFQVATALVHLDQPRNVARLEQRIGRLDRVGRDPGRAVRSIVLRGPSRSEQALFRIHSEVFDVYRRSIGGLEFALPRLQREVLDAAARGAEALEDLVVPCGDAVDAERARVDEAYERSLDSSARALEEAGELAEVLSETDCVADVPALAGWAKGIGIKIKPDDEDVWTIRWTWEHLRRVPPGLCPPDAIPTEGRVRKRGTFSRKRALEDESLEFFGPGHPVIDALSRDVETSAGGRATVSAAHLGHARRGRFHLLLLVRTGLDLGVWGDEEPPAGLLYRARTRLWPEIRPVALDLHPGNEPGAKLGPRDLESLLSEAVGAGRKVDRDDLAGVVSLPSLQATVKQGIQLALRHVAEARGPLVAEAAGQLREDFAEDLGYLRGVVARERNAGRAADAEREIAARERAIESVEREQLQLDALALVLGV